MIQNINQLKQVLSALEITEAINNETKVYTVNSKSNFAVLTGEVETRIVNRLSETVYLNSYIYHSAISLVELDLKPNELLEKIDINLNIQGNNNQSSVIVTGLKYLESDFNRFDYLCSYEK